MARTMRTIPSCPRKGLQSPPGPGSPSLRAAGSQEKSERVMKRTPDKKHTKKKKTIVGRSNTRRYYPLRMSLALSFFIAIMFLCTEPND